MANELINKVVYGGNTLIDLTEDTVTREDVQSGKSFHLKDGSTTTGINTWDSDTKDANATAPEILSGKTAYVNKNKVTGNMPNIGAQVISITTASTSSTISNGYHDGSGYAKIADSELNKLIPSNIRENVTVLGVTGTMSGSEEVNATTAVATPSITAQSITPPTGYNYLTEVTIEAIPYTETVNPQGGKTVSIASS